MVPISKMDVLMEEFTTIQTLIDNIASDREQPLKNRNSWEVFFQGYDDDPREIPDIPDETGRAATDEIMDMVQCVLRDSRDQENPSETMDRNKQIKETMERLTTLENIYGINPKIKKYFSEGRLYYCYITGGFLGSIDTINYDKRYAKMRVTENMRSLRWRKEDHLQ